MTAWTRWPEVAAAMERHPDGKRLVALVRALSADARIQADAENAPGLTAEGRRISGLPPVPSWLTWQPLPRPDPREGR